MKNKGLFLLPLILMIPRLADAARDRLNGKVDVIFAERLVEPRHPSSEAVHMQVEYNTRFDYRWSAVLGLQESFEMVYRDQSNDYNPALRKDAYDFRLQNTYLERKEGEWQLRMGYQQVVWGETWGNSPGDVVIAKDLRRGLPQDLTKPRLSSPMFNLRKINDNFTWESLLIVQPLFHIVATPGSDFASPFKLSTGFPEVEIEREIDLPIFTGTPEWGSRLSWSIGTLDLSAFYLNSFDRAPYYELTDDTIPGTLLSLRERHARIHTAGVGYALETNGFIFRGDFVTSLDRKASVLEGRNFATKNLQDNSWRVSVDPPTLGIVNMTLWYAGTIATTDAAYLTRSKEVQILSFRTALTLGETSWETVLTAYRDGGRRVQSEIAVPGSEQLEWRIGVDNYGGSDTSDYGRRSRGSRIQLNLRWKFDDVVY